MQKNIEVPIFPVLTETEIKQEIDRMWAFLKKTHFYVDKQYQKEVRLNYRDIELAIEVRPLRSDQGLGKRYVKPHYIYQFNNSEYERFLKYCKNLFKKKKSKEQSEDYMPFCLYFGVYGVDINVTPITAAGGEGKVKLAGNTAHCTGVLSMDLDGIDYQEYAKYKKIFSDKGIETIDIATGHGYQVHILLEGPVTDLKALEQFYKAIKALGIPADGKVIDCARVLRLGFFNSKGCLFGDKYYGTPIIAVKQVTDTESRYAIEDVFKALGTEYVSCTRAMDYPRFKGITGTEFMEYPYREEHVGHLPKTVSKDLKTLTKVETKPKVVKTTAESMDIGTIDLKSLYPMLRIQELPNGVKNMLYGFREGLADNTLMFLTIKLKWLGYSLQAVIDVTKILSKLDTFGYAWTAEDYIREKVCYFYSSNYKNVKSEDFTGLKEEFGDLDWSDCLLMANDDKIKIQNSLYTLKPNQNDTIIAKLTPTSFVLWLAVLLDEHDFRAVYKKQKLYNIQDLVELLGKDIKHTREAVNKLTENGFMDKKKTVYKKDNKSYVYYLNENINLSQGFVSIDTSFIETLITRVQVKKLTARATMVYFYLKFRMQRQDELVIAQETIANVLGVDRTAINKVLKELHMQKLLVNITQGPRQQNKYVLLR